MNARIHHIAIVVKDLEESLAFYRDALGLPVERVEDMPEEGVRIAFLPLGNSEIELLEPTQPDTGVARFLEKRGEGLHHVCLEVTDIEGALAALKAGGAELITETPRTRPDGTRYAFIHPRSAHGVLLELYEG